jgi:hypothetical protein
MSIYDDDSDDIAPVKESSDRGIVILPVKPTGRPKNEDIRSDVIKEMIVEDSEVIGQKEASFLHGVNGRTIRDWKSKIEEPQFTKQQIEELATSKLMQTLLALDPDGVDKERDRITIINGLSQVIERVGDPKKDKEGSKVLHLHLYDPGRKKESDYEVIDV